MHVGITQQLKWDVANRIDHHFRKKAYQLEFGCDSVSETFRIPRSHPIVAKLLWGEHEHLLKLMPSEWCEKLSTDKFEVRLQSKAPGTENWTRVDVIITGNKEIVAPPGFNRYRVNTVPRDICPEIRGYFDLAIKEQDFNTKWQKIKSDVRVFLESNKSLNAAIKAWPELRTYIPPQYLNRVDAKPERKAQQEKAAQALAEIDREGAVTAATIVTLAA